jgi:hypothetical protein
MAYINMANPTTTTCYLKNLDTNQTYTKTYQPQDSTHALRGYQAEWIVEQQATPGFPTPHYENVTFWNTRAGVNYGGLQYTLDGSNPSEVQTPPAGVEIENSTTFHVHWMENKEA